MCPKIVFFVSILCCLEYGSQLDNLFALINFFCILRHFLSLCIAFSSKFLLSQTTGWYRPSYGSKKANIKISMQHTTSNYKNTSSPSEKHKEYDSANFRSLALFGKLILHMILFISVTPSFYLKTKVEKEEQWWTWTWKSGRWTTSFQGGQSVSVVEGVGRSVGEELWEVCVLSHSAVYSSATPRTVARQAPLSMGLSRQEY